MRVVSSIASKVWKRLRGKAQWWVLWLVHDKFMIGMTGVCFDPDHRVLLLRHRYWRYSWGLPSGYLARGETILEGFARELAEETKLVAVAMHLCEVRAGYQTRLECIVRAEVDGSAVVSDGAEVLQGEYFQVDALPDGLLPSHRELIQEYAAATGAHDGKCRCSR